MCAPPAASVNDVNCSIPMGYAIHVRYSLGLRRGCAVPGPSRHKADKDTQSHPKATPMLPQCVGRDTGVFEHKPRHR